MGEMVITNIISDRRACKGSKRLDIFGTHFQLRWHFEEASSWRHRFQRGW